MPGVGVYGHDLRDNGDRQLEDKINHAAKQMARARDTGDCARYRFLRERVASMCFEYFSVYGRGATGGTDDVFLEVLVDRIEKHDWRKGELTHAVRFYYSKRRSDAGEKQGKQADNEASLFVGGGDGEILLREIPDERAEDEFCETMNSLELEEIREARVLMELLTLITEYITKTTDSRLEKRKRYVPLFFTETIVRMTKEQTCEEDCVSLVRHEVGLFKAMETPFLDSFMAEVCRKIVEIWRSGFREGVSLQNRLQDVRAGKASYSAWKLPASFYKDYCAKAWGSVVSDATISQQRASYEALVAQLKRK